jgi:hypothetical protein
MAQISVSSDDAQYLADVLPGLADRSIQALAEITLDAYAVRMET